MEMIMQESDETAVAVDTVVVALAGLMCTAMKPGVSDADIKTTTDNIGAHLFERVLSMRKAGL
jgi:hypothetical protein